MLLLTEGQRPQWSPDGERILFYRNDIRIINTDGTNERKVLYGPLRFTWFDDDTIAVRQNMQGRGHYLVKWEQFVSEKHGEVRLTEDMLPDVGKFLLTGFHGEVRWSPDRRWLAIADMSDEAIYVGRADGSDMHKLCSAYEVTHLAWSPDSRMIAFDGSGWGIYAVQVDTHAQVQLVEGRARCPRWSPDGRKLAFVGEGKIQAAVVGTSINLVIFESEDVKATSIDWSWYRNQIAFEGYDGITSHIYLLPASLRPG